VNRKRLVVAAVQEVLERIERSTRALCDEPRDRGPGGQRRRDAPAGLSGPHGARRMNPHPP
jgi:hypothetical protein